MITPKLGACSLNINFTLKYGLDQVFAFTRFLKNKTIGPFCVLNRVDFVRKPSLAHLSEGGRKIFTDPNAGGNSIFSEVFSYEILRSILGLKLERTEMELDYWPRGGKITDYSVSTHCGNYLGVSVTRAMCRSEASIFEQEDAERLLTKKLEGIIQSSKNVYPKFYCDKQILHILAESDEIAYTLAMCLKTKSSKFFLQNTIPLLPCSPPSSPQKTFCKEYDSYKIEHKNEECLGEKKTPYINFISENNPVFVMISVCKNATWLFKQKRKIK